MLTTFIAFLAMGGMVLLGDISFLGLVRVAICGLVTLGLIAAIVAVNYLMIVRYCRASGQQPPPLF